LAKVDAWNLRNLYGKQIGVVLVSFRIMLKQTNGRSISHIQRMGEAEVFRLT
jgi:hypothetical protein